MVFSLNPANYHPARITKAGKDFAKNLYFKDIRFPVKIRDIHKIGINNFIGISVFGNEIRKKYSIYVSQYVADKNMLT